MGRIGENRRREQAARRSELTGRGGRAGGRAGETGTGRAGAMAETSPPNGRFVSSSPAPKT
ncbi:MAG: hypothetical protein ACYCST_12925 [Acidimicrobiales bacterium]